MKIISCIIKDDIRKPIDIVLTKKQNGVYVTKIKKHEISTLRQENKMKIKMRTKTKSKAKKNHNIVCRRCRYEPER